MNEFDDFELELNAEPIRLKMVPSEWVAYYPSFAVTMDLEVREVFSSLTYRIVELWFDTDKFLVFAEEIADMTSGNCMEACLVSMSEDFTLHVAKVKHKIHLRASVKGSNRNHEIAVSTLADYDVINVLNRGLADLVRVVRAKLSEGAV